MKDSLKNKINDIFVKNTSVREWFVSKTFKRISLKKHLLNEGYMPKRFFVPIYIVMACAPFLTDKLYTLFPGNTLSISIIMGLLAFFLSMGSIGCHLHDFSDKDREADDSATGFFFIVNILGYIAAFITFINTGWTWFTMILMGAYFAMIPALYSICYLVEIVQYYTKKSKISLDLTGKLSHSDHQMLSKFLEKDEMEIFLDNYKNYADIPYDLMKEQEEIHQVSHKKKEYLESLYINE